MSRNPMLNDSAFGLSEKPGRSPSEEWAAAQAGTTGTAGQAAQNTAWNRTAYQPGPVVGTPPTGTGHPTQGPIAPVSTRVMSLGGVSAATLLMFVFVIIGAAYGWSQVTVEQVGVALDGSKVMSADLSSPALLIGTLLGAFALAIVTAFVPKIARFTAIPYSLLEGVVLGLISHLYEVDSGGIVLQAILATFGVFAVMLLLYGLRILRATPKFVKGVIAATFGVLAMYAIGWIISLFSSNFQPFWATGGIVGIGISIVIVIIAALNLILDFDFIERGSQNQLPAYMDWYAAFGLVVTLVWLYLELLRLLSLLRNN